MTEQIDIDIEEVISKLKKSKNNWDLYQTAKADYEQQKTISEETKKELNQFIETIASKLGTIADKNEIVGGIDRLVAVEDMLSQANKKLQDQEKIFTQERSQLKDEIIALSNAVDEEEFKNLQLQTNYDKLRVRLEALELKVAQSPITVIKPSKKTIKNVLEWFRSIYAK